MFFEKNKRDMEGFLIERDRVYRELEAARANVTRLENELRTLTDNIERERAHETASRSWRPAKRGAKEARNVPVPRTDPREQDLRSLETKLARHIEPGLRDIPENIAEATAAYTKEAAYLKRMIQADPGNADHWRNELEKLEDYFPKQLKGYENDRAMYLEERNDVLAKIAALKRDMGIDAKINGFYV